MAYSLSHTAKTLLVYLICDYPSHGKQYHALGDKNDNYADKIPKG